jgi:LytS/YehU family sensor histidine kinase
MLSVSVCSKSVISILTEGVYLDEFGIKFTSASYKVRFVVITIVSLSLFYYERYQLLRLEKIKSELNALKAQINPHFLFNSLNSIYGLSLINSNKTSDSILKLSSLMRYVLSESNTDLVYLKQEIEYIYNYIDLQKIRLSDKTTIKYTTTGDIADQKVPPLLFMNFIENAFKYGVSNEVNTSIRIIIQIQQKQLTLIVKNDKICEGINEQISSNIGITNIKKRLQLLYGSDYNLKINDSESIYEIELKTILYD